MNFQESAWPIDPELVSLIGRLTKSERVGLYGLQPAKRNLAQRFGASEASRYFAEISGWSSGWGARRASLTGLRDYARQALQFEELSRSDIDVAPALLGLNDVLRPALPIRRRSVYFCLIENATVCSKSNLVLCDDAVLIDAEPFERANPPVQLDVDAAVIFHEDDDSIWLMEPPKATIPRLPRALSLLGVHSYNFGHWMTEFLPKLWICMGKPGFDDVAILVDRKMPAQHVEALRCFVGEHHQLITIEYGDRVHVSELWVCSAPVYFPVGPLSDIGVPSTDGLLNVDANLYVSLLQTAVARIPEKSSAQMPTRIYLARKDTQHRRLINRIEVEEVFKRHGFVIMDLAEIPFADQVALLRRAKYVAGPDGSSFLNCFFGQPGMVILSLAPPDTSDADMFNQICRALGHHFYTAIGEIDTVHPMYFNMSSFRIDAEMLDGWLARSLGPAIS